MKNALNNIELDTGTKEKLCEFLYTFLTDERKEKFEEVINFRTRHLTVVLENIYQPHNASAVLRSCDLTGIQDVHIIENGNEYRPNPEVAMGSAKWLSIYKYQNEKQNTLNTIKHLKQQGYTIVATTPHKQSYTPHNLPLSNKTALVFGTELTGLTKVALEHADEFITIPQFGFTESYNISVSVALLLFSLSQRLHSSDLNWQLREDEKLDLQLDWARKTIKRSDLIEARFLKSLDK